jgi:holo-[acyl-carrier protein] synthase
MDWTTNTEPQLDRVPRGEVVGIGIDMTDVGEVRHSVERFGERYLRRVFTRAEVDCCMCSDDPAPRLAALFAAKEAVLKAIGVSGAKPAWTSVDVAGCASPSAKAVLTGRAARLAMERGVDMVTVSMTLDAVRAAAVAVATAPPAVAPAPGPLPFGAG